MKKVYSLLVGLAVSGAAFSQCTDLFISEYVEAAGNDKAIELYNPTNAPIDLSKYRLVRWDNGSLIADQAGSDQIQPLSGTIQPLSTWVMTLNVTGDGTTSNPATTDSLKAYADVLYTTNCAPGVGELRTLCFNGDDALSLQRIINESGSQTDPANWKNIDIFACIGERPTNSSGTFSPTAGWTALPPFSEMPSNYNSSVQGPYFKQYWTQNKTMIRKYDVQSGVTTNPNPKSWNPSVEWDSLSVNTFVNLGQHNCVCKTMSVDNSSLDGTFRIYPNPAVNTISIASDKIFSVIEITDLTGKLVIANRISGNAVKSTNLDISDLRRGMYIITLKNSKWGGTSSKLIKN
jgi:hypothetical protein